METFSSLWRRTGGMSAKDAGVDALSVLCSSGEMCAGTDWTRMTGIFGGGRRRWRRKRWDLDGLEERDRDLAQSSAP